MRLNDPRFDLVRTLEHGGPCERLLVQRRDQPMPAVVQVLRAHLAAQPEVSRSFQRLSNLLLHVQHPHLARAHDVGRLADGRPFLVVEHLDGESLAERLRRDGRASALALCDWLSPIAQGLEELWARGVSHGNLQPGSIWLEPGGGARLTAYGLVVESGDRARPADDVWALGALLFEASARHFPLMAAGASLPQLPASHRALAPIIHRCLAPDPQRRFATPAEVGRALEALAHTLKGQEQGPEELAKAVGALPLQVAVGGRDALGKRDPEVARAHRQEVGGDDEVIIGVEIVEGAEGVAEVHVPPAHVPAATPVSAAKPDVAAPANAFAPHTVAPTHTSTPRASSAPADGFARHAGALAQGAASHGSAFASSAGPSFPAHAPRIASAMPSPAAQANTFSSPASAFAPHAAVPSFSAAHAAPTNAAPPHAAAAAVPEALHEAWFEDEPDVSSDDAFFEGLHPLDDDDLSGLGITLPTLDAPPPPREVTRPLTRSTGRAWRTYLLTAFAVLLGAGAVVSRPDWRAALTQRAAQLTAQLAAP